MDNVEIITKLIATYAKGCTYSGNRTGEEAAQYYMETLRKNWGPEFTFTLAEDGLYYYIISHKH